MGTGTTEETEDSHDSEGTGSEATSNSADDGATPDDSSQKKESKWPVRGLDKQIVNEANVKALFVGKYENADPEVKQLFLFGYCDSALLLMSKVPREDAGVPIKVKDYFKHCPEILSAMIRACMLKIAQVKGELPVAGKKGKGGRPKKDGWEFERDMQGAWREYTEEELENRKKASEDEDSNVMTWYKAVVAEMDTKTASATNVAGDKTTGQEQGVQTEGQTGGGKKKSDCFDEIIGARLVAV